MQKYTHCNFFALDLRNLPDDMAPAERCAERRKRIEQELDVSLGMTSAESEKLGHAEERNCEQMFGHVPLPVGYAGPLNVTFSSGENGVLHLPLATTEGALVASVNRGCKAISESKVKISSVYHGVSRSIAFRVPNGVQSFIGFIEQKTNDWKQAGEETSGHLKILSSTIDHQKDHVFLTINGDTDEAMGMNMITIAAQAIANWIVEQYDSPEHSRRVECITIAGNVDSDKKPSKRTHDMGRGYEVTAKVILSAETIQSILKATPEMILNVAKAKLETGSVIAGALGKNMHVANIISALYLATGQDASHTVEGSLADTTVKETPDGLKISVRLPAILVGIRGGGTGLPAQHECLELLMKPKTSLRSCQQLAESIGAAVLAGETSLLAAQASHHLAKAHKRLGR